jgi:hypothetical protein
MKKQLINNYNGVFHYKGFGNCDSKCRLHIKEVTNPRYGATTFICFEDLGPGTGTSVTNFSEELATLVVNQFGLNPKKCRFFESYKWDEEPRTLDEIKYNWHDTIARRAEWSRPELDLTHVFEFTD